MASTKNHGFRPILLHFTTLLAITSIIASTEASVWTWSCRRNFCQKERASASNAPAVSLGECRLACLEHGPLWPRPTGPSTYNRTHFVHINVNSIDVIEAQPSGPASTLVRDAGKRFKEQIAAVATPAILNSGGKSLVVSLKIADTRATSLTLRTDESYELAVSTGADGRVMADVGCRTFFGCRNGLETLGQLLAVDEVRQRVVAPADARITDGPAYAYRGVLLDTSRNYISVAAIKRTLEGMALSKLNTFHWHITDSHSFPYVSASRPELSRIGAYSPAKVYSPEAVREVVEYGRVRGVRVLPEFDAPAHVGEGWQETGFVTCFDQKPWEAFCVEPPCGQFDPTKEGLYDALEDIYRDMVAQFQPDIFHMGGDEVSLKCWNASEPIVEWMRGRGWGRTEADFMKLWNVFQSQALERLDRATGADKEKLPVIMWTSTLTKKEHVEQYLPKERYVIQIWTTGSDKQIGELLDRGYRLILSNYDALYLDCGAGGWVTGGVNWCSPYIGWQKVYDNGIRKVAGDRSGQFLGAEAALWTEQVDDASADGKIWPRAAAMAERLWADPDSEWRAAESRMLVHRERLMAQGIAAEALQPQWCLQHQESCPLGGEFNQA